MLIYRADGTIALDGNDAESLRLADQERTETSGAAATNVDETLIYDSITLARHVS